MIKKIVIFIVLSFSILLSQQVGPFLNKEMRKINKASRDKDLHLLVRGNENLADELINAGIEVQTDMSDMATIIISSGDLGKLMKIPGLKEVVLGPKMDKHNSESVSYQNVNNAYTKGYTGSGVIVGVVDTGIDFYHPMFRKAGGSTRILNIWDQTGTGSPPAGFGYGREFTETQINSDLTSGTPHSVVSQRDPDGHGTHVAGTMAGRDNTISPTDTLHGGAKDANIIFVKTTFSISDINDGINYIFGKAQDLGKPCVVNLSLGSQYGPHDGTDLSTKLTDGLTGAGKIVVRSAGNDGSDAVHYFANNVTGSTSLKFTFNPGSWSQQYVTFWLELGDDLSGASLSWSGGSIPTVGKGGSGSSTDGHVDLYVQATNSNGKKSVVVFVDDVSYKNKEFTLTVSGMSDVNSNGTIERHAWCSGSSFAEPYGAFSQGTLYSYDGSQLYHYPYSLGNAACGEKVVTVGAFVSRNFWVSIMSPPGYGHSYRYSGDVGGIANFSGIGPTAKGKEKPDIIAGGTILLSAKSKDSAPDSAFLPKAPYTDDYTFLQGTSMASPAAAGAIALIMEKNPNWNPTDVKNYLYSHAQGTSRPSGVTEAELKVKEDPNTWDRVFGYGAIDLADAFTAIEREITDVLPSSFRLGQNYPNPFNPTTEIEYEITSNTDVSLIIYNTLGQEIARLAGGKHVPGVYRVEWHGKNQDNVLAPSGMYFYSLETGDGQKNVKKMMLIR